MNHASTANECILTATVTAAAVQGTNRSRKITHTMTRLQSATLCSNWFTSTLCKWLSRKRAKRYKAHLTLWLITEQFDGAKPDDGWKRSRGRSHNLGG